MNRYCKVSLSVGRVTLCQCQIYSCILLVLSLQVWWVSAMFNQRRMTRPSWSFDSYVIRHFIIRWFRGMIFQVLEYFCLWNCDIHTWWHKSGKTARLLRVWCAQILLCGKAVAAGLSGSLSVITSVIDSAIDVVSGVLMWWSNRAVKKRNPYCYPQGIVVGLQG